MQEIGIESSILREIIEGKKTIEVRLGTAKFLKLRKGDRLSLREDIWQNDEIVESISNRAKIEITQILYFESFEDMLHAVDFQKILPSATHIDEAMATYRQFYSRKDEEEYGVMAITFTLL